MGNRSNEYYLVLKEVVSSKMLILKMKKLTHT